MTTTDEELIATIREDNYINYNELFKRYYARLYHYVYGFLRDEDDTKDVVQELFLNLWSNRKQIYIEGNASAFLYRMAKNLALNHIRAKTNYLTLLENQKDTKTSYEENQLELEDFKAVLYNCIDRLPARNKEILLLSRTKGLSQKEIADKLSISVKTIKNQMWTSLKRLKNCLDLKNI